MGVAHIRNDWRDCTGNCCSFLCKTNVAAFEHATGDYAGGTSLSADLFPGNDPYDFIQYQFRSTAGAGRCQNTFLYSDCRWYHERDAGCDIYRSDQKWCRWCSHSDVDFTVFYGSDILHLSVKEKQKSASTKLYGRWESSLC